jgi:hypothetical protein
MRRAIAALLALAIAGEASAQDVAAGPPRDLSVTIYRAPGRRAGSIDLNWLGGFALVTETRDVTIPAGTSRLRFEGVADSIEPASAIVTGLPSGVIEKNRDAHLLSPSALIAAALGKTVRVLRTDPKTGRTVAIPGIIRSDAGGGVVFETAAGVEALRCSGAAETFSFDADTGGASARPTLSVLTRSDRPLSATVTLSYLAQNFDWSADYRATLADDGRTIDLGAWVTLANGNGTSFPDSRTQIVAGRLNRQTAGHSHSEAGSYGATGAFIAQCWPRGSTRDTAAPSSIVRLDFGPPPMTKVLLSFAPITVTGSRIADVQVAQEQLGDLKLYRVPDRTSVASRAEKQVRLLDRAAIPVRRVYGAKIAADQDLDYFPARILLRSRNDAAHHLGLPLPSGRVAVFEPHGGRPVLVGEAVLRDTAQDEDVEFELGESPSIQLRQVPAAGGSDAAKPLPPVPGIDPGRAAPLQREEQVEIANAGGDPIAFELRLVLPDGRRVARADHPVTIKDGQPVFQLDIPANSQAAIRYQTQWSSH